MNKILREFNEVMNYKIYADDIEEMEKFLSSILIFHYQSYDDKIKGLEYAIEKLKGGAFGKVFEKYCEADLYGFSNHIIQSNVELTHKMRKRWNEEFSMFRINRLANLYNGIEIYARNRLAQGDEITEIVNGLNGIFNEEIFRPCIKIRVRVKKDIVI